MKLLCLTALLLVGGGAPALHAQEAGADTSLAEFNDRITSLNRERAYPRAIELAERALEIWEDRLGPQDPDLGTTLNLVGVSYHGLGRHEEAEPYFRRALGISEAQHGPEHRSVGIAWFNIGGGYQARELHTEAEEALSRALGIFEEALGPAHPYVVRVLMRLGDIHEAQGRMGRADAVRETARLAELVPDSARDLRVEADAIAAGGDWEDLREAGDLYESAAALYRRMGNLKRAGESWFSAAQQAAHVADWETALDRYRSAAHAARGAGDRELEDAIGVELGSAHLQVGQPDSALHHTRNVAMEELDPGFRALALSIIGDAHSALGRPDSAHVYYGRALTIYREMGDRTAEGIMLHNIGLNHAELGRPDSALVAFQQALVIAREEGNRRGEGQVLYALGDTHARSGRPDSALVYLAPAFTISRDVEDSQSQGMALGYVGSVHSDLGHPDSALTYLGRALQIARAHGDREQESTVLADMAFEQLSLGRPDSSLAYFREAMEIQRERGDKVGEASVLTGMGVVQYTLGRPDSAAAHERRALQLSREIGDRGLESTSLANLGHTYRELGRPDTGRVYLAEALDIARERHDRLAEGRIRNLLGWVEIDLGRPDSAMAHFAHWLAIARDIGVRDGEGIAMANIGRVFRILEQPDSARAYLSPALAIARSVGNHEGESVTLQLLGEVSQDIGGAAGLSRAVAYYDSAAASVARMATRTGGDADQVTFREFSADLSARWAQAWLARGPDVGERAAALAAWAAAERGRAQGLLDLMRQSAEEADLVPPQPGADLTAEGEALVAESVHGGAAVLSFLVTADTLISWLALPSGDVSVSRRPVPRDSLQREVEALRQQLGVTGAAARSRLGTRSMLMDDPDPDLPPLHRDPTAPQERGLEISDGDPGDPDAWREPAAALAALLLPPSLEDRIPEGTELVVLPQGPLALIPFAVLKLPGGQDLGTRYGIRYAPSLRTLVDGEATPPPYGRGGREEALRRALVVGDPTMPADLDPLPAAGQEARWLGQRLGAAALIGPHAGAIDVKGRMPAAPLVHLATHGYAYSSEARARHSWIALAPGGGHDGLLTVGEILDDLPRLTADLVVLSACQTGLGDLNEAEGTVGLQRAFLARGARSVLVSLWNVSDEATARLMERFYLHWLDDEDRPSKAEALRRAQEDVRRMRGFEHPRFWAPFQLVGAS